MALDPLIINRDDCPKRTRCSLCHGGSLLLAWLRLATSSSARFGAASPTQLCERFCTSSGTKPTCHDVRVESTIGGKPDIKQTSLDDRVCRVGPGNFTPSLSQIRT